jgi:hypothetical protein
MVAVTLLGYACLSTADDVVVEEAQGDWAVPKPPPPQYAVESQPLIYW